MSSRRLEHREVSLDWFEWIPDPAMLDLWVWAILVVPVVVLGVPFIRKVRVPSRLGLREVPETELTEPQRRWLDRLGEALRLEAYEPGVPFRAENLRTANLSRAYLSGRDGSVALAMAVRGDRNGTTLSETLLEFNTLFTDGTLVTTRSRAISDLFDLPPGCHRYIHRTNDPGALRRQHVRHCETHRAGAAVPSRPDELFERMSSFHDRWLAHQMSRGLLRVVDGEWYGATSRLALRGILSFFNPFGDRFSVPRLLAGLAVALVVPLVVASVVGRPGMPVIPFVQDLAPVSGHMARIVALVPVFLVGAAAVGWIFESRAVVWAPLLASLSGWLTLPASTPDTVARTAWLFVLLSTPLVAGHVSNWRHRRQAVL